MRTNQAINVIKIVFLAWFGLDGFVFLVLQNKLKRARGGQKNKLKVEKEKRNGIGWDMGKCRRLANVIKKEPEMKSCFV